MKKVVLNRFVINFTHTFESFELEELEINLMEFKIFSKVLPNLKVLKLHCECEYDDPLINDEDFHNFPEYSNTFILFYYIKIIKLVKFGFKISQNYQ